MAIFRRNKTYWTDFSVNGVRYRQSLSTTDWREAQTHEKELITQASTGKLTPAGQQFARLAFTEAADRYVADRLAHLAPHSIVTERERLKSLRVFFGTTSLTRISAESIRQYIAQRKVAGLSNRTVNMEIGCLARILRRAKRWHVVAEEIKPLPERCNVGRALTYEEKVKLLGTAARRPEWQVARIAMTLALNTTMRGCEIRGLRWRDIDLIDRTLTIYRSKTQAGERVIPLNADAWAAILELRERSQVLCGEDLAPDWYIFPHYEAKLDPTRPMSTWRTAWRNLTREAGLRGLRFHDLRHHAITELAESLASDQTIMSIAGHVSQRMLGHYSQIRLEAKRKALDALSTGDSRGGYGTKHGTTAASQFVRNPQVIEKMVDVTGIEPATPCLQSRCSPS
jgi:integrase